MIDGWISSLTEMLKNNLWIGLVLAFVLGVLTFFTPCGLTAMPMIVGYVGGAGSSKRKAFVYSLFVALGSSVIFVIVGFVCALLGDWVMPPTVSLIFYIIMGMLMILLALDFLGLANVTSKFSTLLDKMNKNKPAGEKSGGG